MVCSLSAATRRGDASAAAEPNSFVMVVCSTEIQRKFADILNERWVYLHNHYHGAAYALTRTALMLASRVHAAPQ